MVLQMLDPQADEIPARIKERLLVDPEIWNVTPSEGVATQERLRSRVDLNDGFGRIAVVAGVDVSVPRFGKHGKCAIVVLSYPDLDTLETRTHVAPVSFPYVPGLLAFRELPIFFETYKLLSNEPDLLLFDGHGYAHPRRFGFACMAGVLLDKPTIGCAKSRLIGDYSEPHDKFGSISPLIAPEGDRIGDVVRTKAGSKPVFVSPGHRISFDTATSIVLRCTRAHRIPEPTRLAHVLTISD